MGADFTPHFDEYTGMTPFRFWCQTVLPSVYDDSLSYYELLNKVVAKLNETINAMNELGEDVNALLNSYNELQKYVNDYFDNLDVQEEINSKIDSMVLSGEFSTIVNPLITAYMHTNAGINTVRTAVHDMLPDEVESQIPAVAHTEIVNYMNSNDGTAKIRTAVHDYMPDEVERQIPAVVAEQLPPVVSADVEEYMNSASGISQINTSVNTYLPNQVQTQLPNVVSTQLPNVVDDSITSGVADSKISDAVSDWLDDNVVPTGSAVIVDDTLTISGAAADAKVTGDTLEMIEDVYAPFILNKMYGETATGSSPTITTSTRNLYLFANNYYNFAAGYKCWFIIKGRIVVNTMGTSTFNYTPALLDTNDNLIMSPREEHYGVISDSGVYDIVIASEIDVNTLGNYHPVLHLWGMTGTYEIQFTPYSVVIVNGNDSIEGYTLEKLKNQVDVDGSQKYYPMTKYPSIDEFNALIDKVDSIADYVGYPTSGYTGVQVDFENGTIKRLGDTNFTNYKCFNGRKRVNVDNDGLILAFYGDIDFAEDGSNGQVMVYQPKFYYKVVPLKLTSQSYEHTGSKILKANYYISDNPLEGFKLHPLFYDGDGNEVAYVYLSAYEGSMLDVSRNAYVNDNVDTTITYETGDLLCSVYGKKPISEKLTGMNMEVFETMANNRGRGWHIDTIKSVSANQLLMLIEFGDFNVQRIIGDGVTDITRNPSYNCSSLTGSTTNLGNNSGMADVTVNEINGSTTAYYENGKLSVSYRGVENPWGNIWKCSQGINMWGDSNLASGDSFGGKVYVCDDFDFSNEKHTGNYKYAGFSLTHTTGEIVYFGYGKPEYDWLFMAVETSLSTTQVVNDYSYGKAPYLTGYAQVRSGGISDMGQKAGAFACAGSSPDTGGSTITGCRLLYVPPTTSLGGGTVG